MPADKLIIVAEGRTDVLITRILLSSELTGGMRFFAAQGRESLATLARNLLVHEGGPLLLVMDVATAELPFQDELLAQVMQALSTVGAPGTFQVFTFIPEIEIVFFEAAEALQRVLGIRLPAGVLEEGQVRPKIVLHRLLAEAGVLNVEVLIRKLNRDEEAIEILSRGEQATALRAKVRAFRRVGTGAGS
jgi:hypothetical protein